ncbi:MAG: AmmeMemoRadiSam system protein A [Candidatus Woesearchaeota archaeon]
MISSEEGIKLLQLAKDSVKSVFEHREVRIDEYCRKKFCDNQGCFVTLYMNGELRGCIGFPEPVMPLYKAIAQASQAAAFEDPRFPQLSEEEFKDCRFEVSVLTKPKQIIVKKPEEYLTKVRIGQDGLIIRGSYGSGLLLPQVAEEYKWQPKEFLEHTCIKAGLSKDAWKDMNNKLYSFQAEIFSEQKK